MKKFANLEKYTQETEVDMGQEEEFRGKIKEILAHKIIAMPYSPVNDEAGILMSQFSKVEDPDLLRYGEFRLFSSFNGTVDKDVNLVGCEILKSGEKKSCARLKNRPRVLSVKQDGVEMDVFTLLKQDCFKFALPLRAQKEQPAVLKPNTNFDNVIDCLTFDLYPSFLKKEGYIDNPSSRKSFLNFLKDCDCMEFVEAIDKDYHSTFNIHTNYDCRKKNMEKDESYHEYCVIFHNFPKYEDEELISAIRARNEHFEMLAEGKNEKKLGK